MLPKGKDLTNLVVGILGLLGVGWAIFALTNPTWTAILIILLTYEAYTLVDKHPKDTLSESVWRFSSMPLIPFVSGVAVGYFFHNNLLEVAVGFLLGHFFWQSRPLYQHYLKNGNTPENQ